MLNAFKRFISDNHLCAREDKILVAVSGGIDSVVLLNLFHRSGYRFGIAHCNFKLRGVESDKDEAFVRKLSEKYQADFHLKTCDANDYVRKNKCSIQEAARDLRYQWFKDLCQSHAYQIIAVGQHADDQVETFFINLMRGSGVAGLKGIPFKRENIIRPLLFANRSDILRYAEDNRLNHREDSSNLSDKYLRNQIRNQLLPLLESIKEDYRSSIHKSLQFLKEDHQMMEQFIHQLKSKLLKEENDIIQINIRELLRQSYSKTILFYLLKKHGFNRDLTDSIYEAMFKGYTGKLFYSLDNQLLIDRDFLILKKTTDIVEDKIYYITSHEQDITVPVSLKLEIIEDIRHIQINKDPVYAYFDMDKLRFPLAIRKWKFGDRFIPLGMKGSKLVSDYLVDQKVDRFEKENVFVLESDGKIAWIIGYRISHEFRITAKTKQAIVIKIRN